ncbi:MAG: hypothetical protein HC904_07750 [Blastochloris sp.]|nr:hypothetical protein [Blastochloris sp.]
MNREKKILFLQGGWPGHQPEKFVQIIATALEPHGFKAEAALALECLEDAERLQSMDVIFPCWTMGELNKVQGTHLQEAVRSGVALAGIHGGMGDAFRGNIDYEWMVGGHFVGHPHVGDYEVRVLRQEHPIMQGQAALFPYNSEQYYMMMDPGVTVLAETDYQHEGRKIPMPVVWIRHWGKGRVFYCSLGHDPQEFQRHPQVLQLTVQGVLWAAGILESEKRLEAPTTLHSGSEKIYEK